MFIWSIKLFAHPQDLNIARLKGAFKPDRNKNKPVKITYFLLTFVKKMFCLQWQ